MRIIIDIADDFLREEIKSYIDCINIDEEFIKSITFEK